MRLLCLLATCASVSQPQPASQASAAHCAHLTCCSGKLDKEKYIEDNVLSRILYKMNMMGLWRI